MRSKVWSDKAIAWLPLGCYLISLIACAGNRHGHAAAPEPTSGLKVVVYSGDVAPVPRADVRWVNAAGSVLTSGTTDAFGWANLPPMAPSAQPRYLLVEREGFLVGGIRYPGYVRQTTPVTLQPLASGGLVKELGAGSVRVRVTSRDCPVVGLRAFWLEAGGAEVGEKSTDTSGVVDLPLPPNQTVPWMLLVDGWVHGCQLVGLKYENGLAAASLQLSGVVLH